MCSSRNHCRTLLDVMCICDEDKRQFMHENMGCCNIISKETFKKRLRNPMCVNETFDHCNEHLNKKVDVSGT